MKNEGRKQAALLSSYAPRSFFTDKSLGFDWGYKRPDGIHNVCHGLAETIGLQSASSRDGSDHSAQPSTDFIQQFRMFVQDSEQIDDRGYRLGLAVFVT